ncbi:recombinase [Microcystis phage vB_MweS-yong2]|nr:recombinase [Microcystis phage vB_MweS-yong2]
MKTYVRDSDRIPLTAPVGGVLAGRGYLIGDLFVVAVASAAAGATFTAQVEGVIEHAKTAAQAVAEGAALYWDNSGFLVTTTVGSNKKIGHAAAAALAADATVRVRLQPV